MPENDVKVKLKASLGMDASDVTKAMTAINQQLQQKAGPAADSESLKYVNQWLQKVMGSSGSYLEQRKKLLASYRDEIKFVRELEHDLASLQRQQANPRQWSVAGGNKEKALSADIREQRRFTENLLETIQGNIADEQQAKIESMGGGGGAIGTAMKAIMKHPYVTAAIGTFFAGKFIKNKMDQFSEVSETMDVGFADLGRRTGAGTGLRGALEPGNMGRVSERMKALGFSGSDVLRMGEAYGMPGAGNASLEAQGGFARAFGFGRNPEEVSGIGRRATQLGIAEPGQQPAFWRLMTDAVMHGQKAGIDASETMRSLLQVTERAAARGGTVTQEFLAGLSGIQKAFSGGASRFFKGEAGAQGIDAIMGGIQDPAGIAQRQFIQNSIRGQFGGRMPTSKDLRFTGDKADIYDQYSDIQKLDYLTESLPELIAGQGPGKFMAGGIYRDLERAAGGNQVQGQLLFQGMTGLSGRKNMNAQLALKDLRRKIAGDYPNVDLGGIGPSGDAAAVLTEATKESRAAMAGQAAPSDVTMLEGKQREQRENMEQFSRATSDATLGLRTFITELAGSVARFLAESERASRESAKNAQQSFNERSQREQSMRSTRPSNLQPVGP